MAEIDIVIAKQQLDVPALESDTIVLVGEPEKAANVTYDNSESGLTATDVQGAIDEVVTIIPQVQASTTDLTAGTSPLETGKLYLVYE